MKKLNANSLYRYFKVVRQATINSENWLCCDAGCDCYLPDLYPDNDYTVDIKWRDELRDRCKQIKVILDTKGHIVRKKKNPHVFPEKKFRHLHGKPSKSKHFKRK